MTNIQLTQELVKSLFDYKDGFLYWKISRTVRIKVGQRAGWRFKTSRGTYRWAVRIGSEKCYYQARIIFLWHKGYMPEFVDHKDRDTENNKIENLRDADKYKNAANVSKQTNKTSIYKGVYLKTNKKTKIVKTTGILKTYVSSQWSAQITVKGKMIRLGCFKVEIEAAKAYNEAAKIYFGEFANLNIIM